MNKIINTEKELQAIIKYVCNIWDGFDKIDIKDFFDYIYDKSIYLNRNNFNHTEFSDLFEKLQKENPQLNSDKSINEKMINGILASNICINMLTGTFVLHRILDKEKNYMKSVNSIIYSLKEKFPDAKKLKPKGWKELNKNYSDHDGMLELDEKALKKEFGGFDSSTAVCGPFELRVSLPHVMYGNNDQSIKPLETLVGAIFAHFYTVCEVNNNSKMHNEWNNFIEKTKKETNFDFKEPLNQALFNIMLKKKDNVKDILGLSELNNTTKNKNML